jgi:hypothetical protein
MVLRALLLMDFIMILISLPYMVEVDFPGLNLWLRNGKKMAMKVHVGCLLIK